MTAPGISTDRFGNRYAAVAVEELQEWAWLLGRLEDWLLRAEPGTIADWHDFNRPGGPTINDVIYVLGHWSQRMRTLSQESA